MDISDPNLEFLKFIVENSHELVTAFLNEELKYISPSVKQVLGYTQEEFLRINHLDLIHPDDAGPIRETIQYRIKNKITEEHIYIYRQKHKDGGYRWLETKEMRKELHGKDVVTVLNSRDITERIDLENRLKKIGEELHAVTEELKEKERFLHAVTDTAPVMMYLYDLREKKNIWVNHGNREYFKHNLLVDPKQINLDNIKSEIHSDDFPKLLDRLDRLKKNSNARWQSVEYRLSTSESGVWRWFHDIGMVYKRDEKGEAVQILCSTLDITEHKKT